MKLTTLMLLVSITAQSQVSIETGLSSRMQGVFKASIEKQTGWNNTEASVMVSTDNMHPVIGLQTGYSTCNEFQQANLRFMAGAFLHTSILPIDKLDRCRQIRFGGSVRYELNHGLIGLFYNGETLELTLGFIFKSRHE